MMNEKEREQMEIDKNNVMQSFIDGLNNIKDHADIFSYGNLSYLFSAVKGFAKKEGFWIGRTYQNGKTTLTVEKFDPALAESNGEQDLSEETSDCDELDEDLN